MHTAHIRVCIVLFLPFIINIIITNVIFFYIYIFVPRTRFFLNLSQRNPLLLYITIIYKNSCKVIIYYIVGVSF